MKKRVAVLGATGSIGKSALEILRRGRDDFEPVLFSAHSSIRELLNLAREFPAAKLALSGHSLPSPSPLSDEQVPYRGQEGLLRAIAECEAEITLNGIAGAAGLAPSLAALRAGSHLALANKETVVMAGPLVFAAARRQGLEILPVDSEHYAIWSLLETRGRNGSPHGLTEILLTASGGPFRTYSREQLRAVTPKEALAHPTWSMGTKITLDSASMANKGLEVIEAVRLFDVPPEKVRVVVHPQSIVHSMIRLRDGTIYAQLSKPDMRLPIQGALYWPGATEKASSFGELSFDALTLNFEKPDAEKFPLLPLAYEAARSGDLYPVAYNAANEAGAASFLAEKTGFLDIPRIVGYVLSKDWTGAAGDLETIMEADGRARKLAAEYIEHSIGEKA